MAFDDILRMAGQTAGAFGRGVGRSQIAEEQAQRAQAEQLRGLQTQIRPLAAAGDFQAAAPLLAQMTALDPRQGAIATGAFDVLARQETDRDKQRQAAFFQDALLADRLLEAGFEDEARQLGESRLADVQTLGGVPDDVGEFLDVMNNQGPTAARNLLQPTILMGQIMGILPGPENAKFQGLTTDQTRAIFVNPATGQVTSVAVPGVEPPEDENIQKIRQETRKRVGDQVQALGDEAATIRTNRDKVVNLIEQVKQGNRTSVAQALISLVKLGDPNSAVLEQEMAAALNAERPTAAITSLLTTKGVDAGITDAVLRAIDPLNPETVNTEDVLRTADALIAANVPGIQARFGEQRQIADENLTPEGVRSIFGQSLTNRIRGLSELLPQPSTPAPAPDTSPFKIIGSSGG